MILWKCVRNYDPDRGASFNTLFQGSARNHCISLMRHGLTKSRNGVTAYLEEEAVAREVDSLIEGNSVEDRVLARMELQEFVSDLTVEDFLDLVDNPRTGTKPVRPDYWNEEAG